MVPKQPQIGDQYRDVGSPFRAAVWILTGIFVSRDGIEHAHLTSAGDATESKTLALSVIMDTKRYVPTEADRVVAR